MFDWIASFLQRPSSRISNHAFKRRRSLSIESLEGRRLFAVGDLRIVSYNVAAFDGDPAASIGQIIQAIGTETYNGRARQVDVLAIQEVERQTTTTSRIVAQLNALYGANTYARGTLNGSALGGAANTQGLIYNTRTVQLVNEATVGTPSTNGAARQTMRYLLRPLELPSGNDFYLYNAHFKAENTSEDADRRNVEATAIRANANALPAGSHIIFAGDFNLYTSNEPAYQTFLSAGNAQAFDPVNRAGNWTSSASFVDVFTQAPAVSPPNGLVGGGLNDRFDFQLLTGAWTNGTGLEYVPGSYRTFANNATVTRSGNINDSSNTALPTLSNRTTILNSLVSATDHLPVVADYYFVSSQTPSVVNFDGTTYTQNFDTLPYYQVGNFTVSGNGPTNLDGRGIAATGVPGWSVTNDRGTAANINFDTSDGSRTGGGVYSFGLGTSTATPLVTDRALGSLATAGVVSRFGVTLVNTTNSIIDNFTLNYVGELWRNGGAAASNLLRFDYALGATNLVTGLFTAVNSLNFVSPLTGGTVGAVNGNSASFQTSIGATVTGIAWQPNQQLVLRWSDFDETGSDSGLAIDNLSFSAVLNSAPTGLALSATSVLDNQPAGTNVGTFTTTDPNVGNTFTYTLVSGTGSSGNASFTIVGNQLRTNAILNADTQSSLPIRVRTTDQGGLSFERTFTITVNRSNRPPVASAGGPYTVTTGFPLVLNGSGSDPDAGQTLTYQWDLNYDGVTFDIDRTGLAQTVSFATSGQRTIALRVTDNGSPVRSTIATTTVTANPAVIGRHIFYRGSSFDRTVDSNNAIDTTKQALLSGQATGANYTNYLAGINGIIVDIAGLGSTALTPADFVLRVGGTSTLSTWTTLPPSVFLASAPIAVVASPAGNGVSRVKLNFNNNAIQNTWLEVTVLANARTGLGSPDVFYFGNARGDVTAPESSIRITTSDVLVVRQAVAATPVAVGKLEDINKDGRVTSQDILAVRQLFSASVILRLINVGSVNRSLSTSSVVALAPLIDSPSRTRDKDPLLSDPTLQVDNYFASYDVS